MNITLAESTHWARTPIVCRVQKGDTITEILQDGTVCTLESLTATMSRLVSIATALQPVSTLKAS
jgi:hypothetical protein